jgi:hypothetical protein
MIKVDYGKTIILKPYTTAQEKTMLLNAELYETYDIDFALEVLKDNISVDYNTFSKEEKIAILYKLRTISISEKVSVSFKCTSCKSPNFTDIDITDVIVPGIPSDDVSDQFKKLTDDNFREFVDIDIDELELDEYDKLFETTQNSITKFNFTDKAMCHKCKTEISIDISSPKFIIENLSEDSLMSLYKTTSDLIYYSHYTKYDVDNMLPFERSIFVGLLNSIIEEKNK